MPTRSRASASAPAPVTVRLIRRNGTVVPWNESKIEIACRKAFLTTKEDAESAIKIARAVTCPHPPRR